MGTPFGEGFRWALDDGAHSPQGAVFGLGDLERHVGRGEYRGLEFIHVKARKIINEVPPAARMAFRYTINAYRGCSHACTYCFARPTHEYLGLGSGEDFETKIVVKLNAVELARAELASPRWRGELIAMGTNTGPYQHAEGKYRLTRGIVQALSEARNPFSILTKSTLVLRDTALLAEAARRTSVQVNLSVGTLDREVWRLTEPGTPPPDKRLDAVRRLMEAGVPCGVLIAPVLPGLSGSDGQVSAVAEACRLIGAPVTGVIALHLRPGVKEHYLSWLERISPDLLALYAERFGRGSYQDKAEQERLCTLVERAWAGEAQGDYGRGRGLPTKAAHLPLLAWRATSCSYLARPERRPSLSAGRGASSPPPEPAVASWDDGNQVARAGLSAGRSRAMVDDGYHWVASRRWVVGQEDDEFTSPEELNCTPDKAFAR
jgi:DNA repair photolyase